MAIDKEKKVQDCEERYRQTQDAQYGDIDYKIIGEQVDGDRAEVEYEITLKKGEKQTQTAFLKKDEEGWKILRFGSSSQIGPIGPSR